MNELFSILPMDLDDIPEMSIPTQGDYTLLLIGGIEDRHYLYARRRVEGRAAERIFEEFLAGVPGNVLERRRLALFGEGILTADAAHSRFILSDFRGSGSYRQSPLLDLVRRLLTEYADHHFPGYSVRIE